MRRPYPCLEPSFLGLGCVASAVARCLAALMETWLLFLSSVVLMGILAQWLAWRFRFPSILALLAFGFVGGQVFDQEALVESDVLFAVVSLSVAVIMLEGGLTLKFRELREAGQPVIQLVSLGAAVTWVLATVALHYLANFCWEIACLVGAILVVTGPTVIGPLLRNVRPKRNLNSILKWEGIVIDPVGAILAVLVFGALFGHGNQSLGWQQTLMNLGLTVLVGTGLGVGAAWVLVQVLKRHWIPGFLQSVVILAVGLALFTISNLLQHESGLLTVTVLGIGLANQRVASVGHIIEFKENLRILLISCLFIVLGGRVSLEAVTGVWKEALALIAVLVLVIRPASVFLSGIGTSLTFRDKVFLACLAPRGIVAAAVSAIFALQLVEAGGPHAIEAERITPLVFCVIFGTVTIYGLGAAPLAKKLGVASPNPQGLVFAGAPDWAVRVCALLQEQGFQVLVIDSNYEAVSRARMAGVAAVNASAISDYASEELDLSGMGRFVAVTSNDEVNSLACLRFAHVLGRSNVFQLEPVATRLSERKSSSGELSGRHLFGEGVNSVRLHEWMDAGAEPKSTPITREFTVEAFLKQQGDRGIPMFIIRSTGELVIITGDSMDPKAGDSVVSLIVPMEPSVG